MSKRQWPDQYYKKFDFLHDEGLLRKPLLVAAERETTMDKKTARDLYKEFGRKCTKAGMSAEDFTTKVQETLAERKLEGPPSPQNWVDAACSVWTVTQVAKTIREKPVVAINDATRYGGLNPQSGEVPEAKIFELPEVLLVGGHISKPGPVRHEQLEESSESSEQGDIKSEERVRKTRRVITDTDGHEAATKLVGTLNTELRRICTTSPFGRICRMDREAELRGFIRDARVRAREFNSSELGRFHKVHVKLVPGMITADSERVAGELVVELRGLFAELQDAVDSCNVERIRDIAMTVKEFAPVFPQAQQDIITNAVKGARQAANTLAREVERKGREIAEVRLEIDSSPVNIARMKFLSLPVDEEGDLIVAESPVDKARFSAVKPDSEEAEDKPSISEGVQQRFAAVNGV